MDFEQIRFFLTLTDTLSYTKASQKLYISQSMLTRHIKAIEKEVGAELFLRSTKGVSLTPAGRCLANGLKTISSEYSFLISQARAYDVGEKGSLQIGVLISGALGSVAGIIASYELSHPDIRITFSTVESPDTMYQALIERKIDFALGIGIPMYKQRLAHIDICRNELFVVLSSMNELAHREGTLSIDDLKEQRFITPADSISTAYKELIVRCSLAGFMPNVLTVPDILSVALSVEMNRGITFFHEHSVFFGANNLVFRRLSDIDSGGTFTMYWDPANTHSKIESFAKYMENSSKRCQ